MKKLILIISVGFLAVLLGSCSSVSYVTDWDTHHDFTRDSTFAWYELPERPDRGAPSPAPNAIVASRIRNAVTGELGLKGLTPAEPGKADLLVTYHIALQRNMHVYYGGWGYPYHGCWGWGGGGYSSARMVTRGTLIVDVLDGKKRSLVWRGIAEGAFSRPNPSENDVAKIVSRLLAEFPVR
ncbi:MAG: DUF4136 domain-containing protein [Acidobacteriota bacterium]